MTAEDMIPWAAVLSTGVAGALTRASPPWVRLVLAGLVPLSLGWALLPLTGSLLQPAFPAGLSSPDLFGRRLLLAVWWLVLARTAILAGQFALRLDRQHRPTRLASDLAAGMVYLAAAIAVLDLAFGISVTGLVATSGIIAIVLGLALQSTLGDLFSGLAIGIDRPFKVGDHIWIEGELEGRVIEISWRSTRLCTLNADVATVPNSVVAKSRLVNRSSPSDNHTEAVRLILDPDVTPAQAMEVLRAAVLNAALLSPASEPSIACTDLRGEGFVYEITFSAPLAQLAGARSDLLRQVARHMRHAGYAFAPQNGIALRPRPKPTLLEIISANRALGTLSEEHRRELAVGINLVRGQAGATVVRQESNPSSMYIIVQGAFEVLRSSGGVQRRLGTIGPGDDFGDLTSSEGTPNGTTVRALTSFEVYEFPKERAASMLGRNPDLLHSFEQGRSKAQTLLDRTTREQARPKPTPQDGLFDRIGALFGTSQARSSALSDLR